jgi:GntR family transcriptional regulator, transcriptional repressor for pyruvate dehydrogenase complex
MPPKTDKEPFGDWFIGMMAASRSVPNEDNVSAVRARLQSLIDKGELGLGGRFPAERELSEVMGVGRRAVRRALEALEAEGLIWRRQGKGTFAGVPPDPTQVLAAEIVGETNVLEVMEARLCIEPVLAAMCAKVALPADIERMRNLARRTVEAPDPDSIELWDGALHRLIARTAANRPLLTAFSLIDEIRANQNWRGLRSRARSQDTLKVSDREHHAVIDRIEAGDPVGAEAAMRTHLQTLERNMRRIITPEGDASEMRKT